MKFDELGLRDELLEAIDDLGFNEPMPIQQEVIPILLKDDTQDVIALAQTGTGKTAAFGLPILNNLNSGDKKIQALILSPTRELCLQIADDLKDYSKYLGTIKVGAVFGGSSIEKQIKMIKKGVQVVVATPGRLVDLINRKVIKLGSVKKVILDEADEMLNMGFRDELNDILSNVPKEKQTLLFSATMPKEINKIAKNYMNSPKEIAVSKKNIGAENIEHVCYFINARDRYLALKRIADFNPNIYAIVFCKTRRETQEVADKLIKDGYNADSLHGDLSQAQREVVMNKFRIKHLKLLVATDVAARGLDVNNLTHVINYNLPDETEIYTHRSGRTGRAGNSGISVVIAHLKEKHKIRQIEKQIGKKFTFQNVPGGKDICERQLFHLIDRMEKVEVDYSQIEEYLPQIHQKLEWLDRDELIRKFVSLEFNRFLEYYKNSKDLSIPLEGKKKSKSSNSDGNFDRFFLNLGRRDALTPVKVIGMVKDYTEIKDIEIGDIEILENFSFFEIEHGYVDDILTSFSNRKLKNRSIAVEVAEAKTGGGKSNHRGKRNSGRRNSDNGGKPNWKRGRKNSRSGGRRDRKR